jgi:hypothetical protein
VLRERQKPGPALRTLAWDADTAPDIAGYRLYCGTSSGVYTQTIEVGNTTATLVSNLTEGKTHFFAVTAYEYCCSRKCAVKRSVVCRAHCHTKPLSDTDSNPDPDANTDSDPHNYAFGLADDGYHRGECDLHIMASSVDPYTAITVNYSMKGKAHLGTNYPLSGTYGQVTIPAGATSASVTLRALPTSSTKTAKKGAKATMTLQSGTGYKVSSSKKATKATVTIH